MALQAVKIWLLACDANKKALLAGLLGFAVQIN
jgi:hypothetical protein